MTTLVGRTMTTPMAPATTSEPLTDVHLTFREAMSSLAGGVCVITTDDRGTPTGLTVTTGFSVSLDPPLFGICVDNASRTLPALLERGAFVANIMAGSAAHVASSFASKSEDKFSPTSGPITRGTTGDGLPWLPDDCLRAVECTISQVVAAGDHTIIIGAVHEVHVPDQDATHGLGYLERTFHTLPRATVR
ncbi:flavin reductase family protein [Sanguibacter antarcticus]|uniref:Flavin reductase (DIM6/NTAB) family NADH-FMN oxidoreductase RutF n=1 Tax=Sanguibacter antarcticus TaxID=372484 RepID=A0A2A9E6X0_9MICO|nr:flavin reductase family protein [Sanguibacter antarcticus]PFG34396.1 flavin reductase (DIM6/NTAB) family NADH-FMN oxidoreductase RutF [Sanguibacter antarcticus]